MVSLLFVRSICLALLLHLAPNDLAHELLLGGRNNLANNHPSNPNTTHTLDPYQTTRWPDRFGTHQMMGATQLSHGCPTLHFHRGPIRLFSVTLFFPFPSSSLFHFVLVPTPTGRATTSVGQRNYWPTRFDLWVIRNVLSGTTSDSSICVKTQSRSRATVTSTNGP